MKNIKRSIVILIVLIAIALGSIYVFRDELFPKPRIGASLDLGEVGIGSDVDYSEYEALYDELYAINSDYMGTIVFDSGLVEVPVVYADDYDEYLRTDFETKEYYDGGTVYLDPNASLDSQNMTFYGHTFLNGERVFFTPLHDLVEAENYEQDKYLSLILKDEIRRYQVAYVYYADILLDNPEYPIAKGMEYMFPEFSDEALDYYLNGIEAVEFYDTGVEITSEDKFITFQTCVKNRDDLRLIIVSKEIDRIAFDENS